MSADQPSSQKGSNWEKYDGDDERLKKFSGAFVYRGSGKKQTESAPIEQKKCIKEVDGQPPYLALRHDEH